MCRNRSIAVVLIALLALGATDAWAQARGRGGPPRDAQRAQRGNDDTLSDSVRRIERDTRGEVLSAERVPFDGREVHRVKVLDDRGRVRVYMDDPQSHRRDDGTRGDDRTERRRRTRDDDD